MVTVMVVMMMVVVVMVIATWVVPLGDEPRLRLGDALRSLEAARGVGKLEVEPAILQVEVADGEAAPHQAPPRILRRQLAARLDRLEVGHGGSGDGRGLVCLERGRTKRKQHRVLLLLRMVHFAEYTTLTASPARKRRLGCALSNLTDPGQRTASRLATWLCRL